MDFSRDSIQFKTSTELVRSLQTIKQQLQVAPIQITSHGRDEFVVISQNHFNHLKALSNAGTEHVEAKLKLVLDTITSHIIILDNDLKIRRANKAFCDFFGHIEQEIVGQPIDILPRTANDSFLAIRARWVLDSGKAESFEIPSSHRPGRILQVHLRPWPQGVALFLSDKTDSSHLNALMLRDLAHEASLAAAGGIGSFTLKPDGEITLASEGLAKMLATTRAALRGTSIRTLLGTECVQEVKERLKGSGSEPQIVPITYLKGGEEFAHGILSMAPFANQAFERRIAATIIDPAVVAQMCEGANDD